SAILARASGARRVIGFSIWHLREKGARPFYSDTDDNGARLRSRRAARPSRAGARRSEEHTSELQSLTNLVCRLLLEKKIYKQHIRSLARQRKAPSVRASAGHLISLAAQTHTRALRHLRALTVFSVRHPPHHSLSVYL